MTAETPNTTPPEPLPDRWGVVANYDGDSYVSAGALCWLASVNGGAERYEFVVQSRGGRLIRRYMERDRLSNWRAKFVPPHLRGGKNRVISEPDRAGAEKAALMFAPAAPKEASHGR